MSMLKKYKNIDKSKLLSNEELDNIKGKLYNLKEESTILCNKKDKKYADFKRLADIGTEMSILQKRLNKSLKLAKKVGI